MEDGIAKPRMQGFIMTCTVFDTPRGQHVAVLDTSVSIIVPLEGSYPFFCGERPSPTGSGTCEALVEHAQFPEFCCGWYPLDPATGCNGPITGTPDPACGDSEVYYADCCGEIHDVNPYYPLPASFSGTAVLS